MLYLMLFRSLLCVKYLIHRSFTDAILSFTVLFIIKHRIFSQVNYIFAKKATRTYCQAKNFEGTNGRAIFILFISLVI